MPASPRDPPSIGARVRRSGDRARSSGHAQRRPKTVDLETKTRPAQDRSRATFDTILQAAGELLAEHGIDGFTVNAVVRRAGLTPPAIYRYFPNKYAILKALGERLMQAQDDLVIAWNVRRGTTALSETALIQDTHALFKALVEVTSAFPGSVAILRGMRAVPVLRDVRTESERRVADVSFERLRLTYPNADPERLRAIAWLIVQMGNSVFEMVLDGEGEDPAALLREAAIMFARLQTSLV